MGNSTNKLPFSSSQTVRLPEGKPPFSYGFLWFSYGFGKTTNQLLIFQFAMLVITRGFFVSEIFVGFSCEDRRRIQHPELLSCSYGPGVFSELTGNFYGIIHSINGVLLVLITGKGP